MTVLLEVINLTVRAGDEVLVNRVSLTLMPGQSLTILGQTGAGKSLLAQAIMGLLPEGLDCEGEVFFDGKNVTRLPPAGREALWGREICLLPQEPWHALDPLMQVVRQVGEVHELVLGRNRDMALNEATEALVGVGLEDASHKYPWELSGGMAQRAAWCAATAAGGKLVLADEPTKGLDARNRDGIARLLRSKADSGAVLTITHDVEVARQLGGRIMVMRRGQLIEQGDATTVLKNSQADYTRELIAAAPVNWLEDEVKPSAPAPDAPVVLSAERLCKARGGRQLINDVSLQIRQGEIIGITGVSGSGKTTLGDMLLGLLRPDAGDVTRAAGIAKHRYLKLYQDPPTAFAPDVQIAVLFDELMRLHGIPAATLPPLLDQLELSDRLLSRTSSDVSGGELQRLALARALLLEPVFLFADEPVSRLDPITAKIVVRMLINIASQKQCAVMLVSHDPDMVQRTCHRSIDFGR